MIKKLFLWIIILFITYILIIFNIPSVASLIGKTLGTTGFNEYVLSFQSTYNKAVTDIPSKEEFINGVIDIKDNVIDTVDLTKEKIDDIRVTMSGVETKYNELKEDYDNAKEFINTHSGKIEDIKNTINSISEISTFSGEIK